MVPRDGSRLQRCIGNQFEDPERLKETGRNRADLRDAGVTPQRAARSCPYLSTLQPHFGHVHPPHIASAIDAGRRIAGMDVPQRGQAGLSDPMPHRPFVFDCLTTKKPTSTAAIASAMKPMPSMTRCAFPPEDCYAPAQRTRLLCSAIDGTAGVPHPWRGAPLLRAPIGSRPAARAGTHVTTNDLCNLAESAGFWCGRRGGISNRRAWKARADALCVAPAPRDGAAMTFGAPAVPAKMVEVPNPLKFLG